MFICKDHQVIAALFHNSIATEGHKDKIYDFVAVEAKQCDIIEDYHIAELPRRVGLCNKAVSGGSLLTPLAILRFLGGSLIPLRETNSWGVTSKNPKQVRREFARFARNTSLRSVRTPLRGFRFPVGNRPE